jgi:isoaspartyl peptidase/L-asparaginase-like protein (Ntn-hydrolase superfamily)
MEAKKETLMAEPIVIATWPYGRIAAEAALPLLAAGKPALDAAIAGAQAVEDDPEVRSVGYGGLPDALGRVTLDASVMDGATLSCGAVAAVENVVHVAALARRVMEKTPHILLVGEGALAFAVQQGFPLQNLLTPESLTEWEKRRARRQGPTPADPSGRLPDEHDTVTVLTLDAKGSLGGACTTSGLALKMHGRVGDSPLIGHALYVDNTAGAAGATGVGEEVIRIGGSLRIVEAMRHGKSPQEACELAAKTLNEVAVRRGVHVARVAFLALDPKGNVGAACTASTDFHFAVGRAGKKVELRKAKEIAVEK